MKKILLVATLILSLFSIGCANSTKSTGGPDDGTGLSESDLNSLQESRFGAGSIPVAEGEGLFKDVHFNYDSAEVSSEAMQNIEYNAQILQSRSGLRAQLEGHCDERGTAEYNLALGSRRARAVMDVLVSLGIPSSRMDTISYGEEVPLDAGHNENAFARNRRVHLSAFENR